MSVSTFFTKVVQQKLSANYIVQTVIQLIILANLCYSTNSIRKFIFRKTRSSFAKFCMYVSNVCI